jgi:hypothetical protein
MNTSSSRLLLSAFAFIAAVPWLQAQTANVLSHTVIVAQPPDPIHYEKAIGNYTSTTYPSFFLGTGNSGNGYIYDTQTGKNCSVGIPGYYYERSRTFTYPGDTYAGVIASLFTSVAWLENPLNYGGSLCGGWGTQTINPNRGAHTLHVVDLDGDGKMDVLASGGEYPTVYTTGFIDFQNSYNSWVLGSFAPASGDSIDIVGISGVNGGARTNIVGCNSSNNSLYWFQNPGGSAARGSGWTAHLIASTVLGGQPACNEGVTLASLTVGNRDIVIVASGETGSVPPWAPGLGYYDPGSTPDSTWTFHQLDSTYTDVHEIATDVLNGTPFFAIAEQEQASTICNGEGLNDHGTSYSGCRVAIFPWNGSGFNTPTLASNLGSHNQTLYQLNGVEYLAGANHDSYEATDPAYNLWTFNFGSTTPPPPPTTLASGTYNIKNPNTGDTMDIGWALNPQWGDGPYVYLYNYNNGATQQITYTSAGKLQSATHTADYLYNDGGALAVGSSGDTFSITSSGTGYAVKDTTAGGLYVNNAGAIDPPNKLSLSSTPTVWMFPVVSGSGSGGGGGGSLATGKPYTFQDGNGYTMDLGWAQNPQWGDGPYIYLYKYNAGSTQQITFTTAGKLQSASNSAQNLYDDGGVLAMGSTGDTFTITSSGSGYTIFDSTVGLYVNSPGKTSPPNKLALSSTPTVWTATLQ